MHITMIKKRLLSGEPCRKCAQAEDMLRRRGLWERIDEVVWAEEGNPDSPGMVLGREHGVEVAPFFLVTEGVDTTVYTSALGLIKERLSAGTTAKPGAGAASGQAVETASAPASAASAPALAEPPGELAAQVAEAARSLAASAPQDILQWGLTRFGSELAIAFSGAEDVVLIDMAVRIGQPFSVFCLDTGRLHPETYEFIDKVRSHYGIEIRMIFPDAAAVEELVRAKGLFSFYDDGHEQCCGIRKVAPLTRALADYRAWATGQRRDQSPTRTDVPIVQMDGKFRGTAGPLVKLNPLAGWSSKQTWDYIRDNEVPHNALHERGFVSIGCAPCTRPVLPGQHEREGRWWWELATARECGLHAKPRA